MKYVVEMIDNTGRRTYKRERVTRDVVLNAIGAAWLSEVEKEPLTRSEVATLIQADNGAWYGVEF